MFTPVILGVRNQALYTRALYKHAGYTDYDLLMLKNKAPANLYIQTSLSRSTGMSYHGGCDR